LSTNGHHMINSNLFIWEDIKNQMPVIQLGGKRNHPAILSKLQLLSLCYNLARDTEAKDADLVFVFLNRDFRTISIVCINKSPLVCCRCILVFNSRELWFKTANNYMFMECWISGQETLRGHRGCHFSETCYRHW
jgi:hypothetical protein